MLAERRDDAIYSAPPWMGASSGNPTSAIHLITIRATAVSIYGDCAAFQATGTHYFAALFKYLEYSSSFARDAAAAAGESYTGTPELSIMFLCTCV